MSESPVARPRAHAGSTVDAVSDPIDPTDGAIPELIDLGQRLRRAREGRGIGVAELADRLHLAPEQLIALESGDRVHLHEPVFVIAQAKRVAQALGLDIREQVESLRRSRLMESPAGAAAGIPAGAAATPVAADPNRPAPPQVRAPWGLAAAVAALTVLLGVLVAQLIRFWSPGPLSGRLPVPGAPGPSAAATTPAADPATAAGPGVLRLRSDEPSWVEVRDASGRTLFSGQLEKEARFRLGEGLRVLAGRPDLVTASVGGEAPRRLGEISEVRWQDFPPAAAPTPKPAPTP